MGDQEISIDRRDFQALLRNVTPRLQDAQAQLDYLRAMTCTKSAADKALALQQAAAVAGEGDGGEVTQAALAAAEAELTSLADDLCAKPPRLQLSPLQYWPSWWWPWPWPPPQWDQGATADPAAPPKDLSAAVLLACGAQLQDIADLIAAHARHEPFHARHEPFAEHARHEPFATAAGRLLSAGLAALSHDR
jgi:hypothetical protein